MKRIVLSAMLPALLLLASCEKEKEVQSDDLPAKASTFISTHYSTQAIRQVIKERDDLRTAYIVYLDNSTRIEFTRNGDVKEIDGTQQIPDAILPALVLQYVNTNYPTEFVRGWDPGDTNQEVELSSGVELLFDSAGNFLRIDD